MNHDEAIRSGAAEKYVLRELSDELRNAYEDHFLECAECTKNMHALSGFAEAGAEEGGCRPGPEGLGVLVLDLRIRSPMIDLAIGYNPANTSPLLKFLLSKTKDLKFRA